MIKECVVSNGSIINIGAWDEQRESVEVEPALYDEDGNITKEAIYEDQMKNPFPEGATIEERDFEYDSERGWYEVGTEAPKTSQQEIDELKQLIADLASLQLGV